MLPTTRRRIIWDPLESIRGELERVFEGFPGFFGGEAGPERCPVDVWQDDQYVYLEADLPGFRKNDIDVNLQDDTLRISAERKSEEKKGQTVLTERRHVCLKRQLQLPSSVDESQIEARFADGVLRLKMKKEAGVPSCKIDIA